MLVAADRRQRMARQILREVTRDAYWPHARPAAAVRDRECLVQVQVAHVGANRGRTGQSYLCVHVGAVHTPGRPVVDDLADFLESSSSNTPWVEGYVIIRHASRSRCWDAFRRKSSRSTLPFGALATTTTRRPPSRRSPGWSCVPRPGSARHPGRIRRGRDDRP